MVFFRTRLGKILIWKKFSETWEPDFKLSHKNIPGYLRKIILSYLMLIRKYIRSKSVDILPILLNWQEAYAQWCFTWKVYLKISSKFTELVGAYLKKTPTQMFFCKFCEIFKITFYRIPPMAAFETFYLHVLILKLKLKKIKETSNYNQIYFFFETYSCWKSMFKLQMQAYMIFLTRLLRCAAFLASFLILYKVACTKEKNVTVFNFVFDEETASMKFYLTEALLPECEKSSFLIFILNGFSFISNAEIATIFVIL